MPNLPHVPTPAFDPARLALLRGRAASRLTGPAAAKGQPASVADALTVLHTMASSPETAADALTLLHELQVHQVEVDLQAQELHESRSELETALRVQIELYDLQPVGCFTVDAKSVVLALNRAGAAMLGVAQDEALGMPLDAFLSLDSARSLRAAMSVSGPDARSARPSNALTLRPKGAPERPVLASVGGDPAAGRFLINLTNLGPAGDGTGPAATLS